MTRRPAVTALIVTAAASLLAMLGAQPAVAAAPRPDNPNGASITLSGASFSPGDTVSFTGTGWTTTASKAHGAVLGGVKLDDTDQLNAETFTADAAGKLSGSVDLPAGVTPGQHWLRFLSGSDQPGDPVRSLHAAFRVVAATPPGAGTSPAASSVAAAPDASTGSGTSPSTRTVAAGAGAGAGNGGGGATLPKTGMDISTTVWLCAGLVAVAAALVGTDLTRRRRRR